MVPLVDLGVVSTLKKSFPNYSVVWSPTAQAIKAMSVAASQKNLNFPSISVFRSSEEYADSLNNRPKQTWGTKYKYLTEDGKQVQSLKQKFVYAIYDILVASFKLSDINDINRILTFYHWNTPVTITYDTLSCNFMIEYQPPTYDQIYDDHSEKVRYHTLNYQFRVLTQWVEPRIDPTVLEVFNKYYNIVTNGDPVHLEDSRVITTVINNEN